MENAGLNWQLTIIFNSIYILAHLLAVAGLFSIFNQALYFTYFWQLKEYRLDRMKDFLSIKSGREKFWPLFLKMKWLLSLLTVALFFVVGPFLHGKEDLMLLLLAPAGLGWLIEIGEFLIRVKSKKIYRPDITSKAVLVLLLTIVPPLILVIWFGNRYSSMVGLFPNLVLLWIISILIMPLNAVAVAALSPITILGKNRAIAKARAKISQLQGLKVIGITGSYGKSSTKEFLAQILETRFKVLKTPGNTNTDIGVAGIILKDLKPEHEVFIVEMGAYKIGEIKKIVDLVAPRIGIITAVKDAHLALFGSLENIKKAKFELIEGLPEFGTGIFNLDNYGSADLAERAKKLKLKIIGYSATAGHEKKSQLCAEKIKVEPEKIEFELAGTKFSANLFGEQNIPNLMAAIATAIELGLKMEEIAQAVQKITLARSTMNLKKASKNLWIIDDSYNANPDGVMAGINYLNLFKDRKKILVFPGMLELGEQSDNEHKRIALRISEVCDFAIFTSKDFEKSILAGLDELYADKYSFVEGGQVNILNAVKEQIGAQPAIVLFVSRGADQVIKKLMQQK